MAVRGRPLRIDWQHTEDELLRRYRQEKGPELKVRWHALWLVRKGATVRQAAQLVGIAERTVGVWLRWYRKGGLAEVARHHRAGRQGRRSHLTPEQLEVLKARVAEGAFRTIGKAVEWVAQEFGQHYTYWGMRSLFRRLKYKKKVPRPLGATASLEAQEAWKKGGLLLSSSM